MTNEVVNSGTTADTTNIDEVIAYLESPEYLRMIARAQGESPDSLLSGSRTEPWTPAPAAPTPSPTLSPLTLVSGGAARILHDYPWSAPLHPGDRVILVSEEFETSDDPDPIKWFRVRDESGNEWSVPSESMEPITTGLADWERELLEAATAAVPQRVVFEDLDHPEPEDEPEYNAPTAPAPTGVTAATFGVDWHNGRCECSTCRPPAPRVTTPVRRSPVQLRVRDPWWEFRHPLHDRREFNTYGSLRGRVRPESTDSGYLSTRSAAAAQLWRADQSKIDYVVYSYSTPIAWHVSNVNADGDGEWVYPAVRYSSTTSAQQTKIRTALEANENQYMIDSVREIREA